MNQIEGIARPRKKIVMQSGTIIAISLHLCCKKVIINFYFSSIENLGLCERCPTDLGFCNNDWDKSKSRQIFGTFMDEIIIFVLIQQNPSIIPGPQFEVIPILFHLTTLPLL